MTSIILEPADVFATRGRGILSRLIRVLTRQFGEKRTRVNHVGIVVEGGPVERAVVVEALAFVTRHPLFDQYSGGRDEVAVFRPLNLSEEEKRQVVAKAQGYVGRSYGYLKLGAHLLDWALLGAYVFRRVARSDDYPICSWLVAHAFGAVGKHFGVAAGAATPDDIWDFMTGNPDRYRPILPLAPLVGPADR